MSGIGHYHRRTSIALRANLRQENIVEVAAVNAFDKQHRAAVGRLLELPLRQRRHTGVRFRLRQHFILVF